MNCPRLAYSVYRVLQVSLTTVVLMGFVSPAAAITIAETDGWTIALDGFVYYQWAFDDNELARSTHLGYVSGSSKSSRSEMSWDATRIGLAVSKDNNGSRTSGRIEFDFHNGHSPRFRHAYISHQCDGWQVLVGQTWLLIGDNGPAINNDDWLWMQGNVHDRLPQVRVTRTLDEFELSLSLNQQPPSPLLLGGQFAASAPTWPWVQGRLKKSLNDGGFLSLAAAAGVWHFEGSALDGRDDDLKSWIVRGDVDLPLSKVRMIAALWGSSAGGYGSAVTQVAYLDGDLQVQPVVAWGGFLNIVYPLSNVLDAGLFSGVDDPEDRPENIPLVYRRNLTVGGNAFWHITPYLTYSLEVQFAQTEYDRGSSDRFRDVRIMGAAKFEF